MNDETLQRIVAELEMLAADAEPRSHITQEKPDSFIFLTQAGADLAGQKPADGCAFVAGAG